MIRLLWLALFTLNIFLATVFGIVTIEWFADLENDHSTPALVTMTVNALVVVAAAILAGRCLKRFLRRR